MMSTINCFSFGWEYSFKAIGVEFLRRSRIQLGMADPIAKYFHVFIQYICKSSMSFRVTLYFHTVKVLVMFLGKLCDPFSTSLFSYLYLNEFWLWRSPKRLHFL